jgi:hypothetical protein
MLSNRRCRVTDNVEQPTIYLRSTSPDTPTWSQFQPPLVGGLHHISIHVDGYATGCIQIASARKSNLKQTNCDHTFETA